MSKLVWDQDGQRFYETGVCNGVLYPKTASSGTAYASGVAWNGLISVSENPSGGEPNPLYADNMKYLNLMSNEEFEGTIEAYTYPDEFAQCDGSAEAISGVFLQQQSRVEFGFSYVTKIGSDSNENLGYKIHLVYGAKASPSDKSYETINETPDAITFSWDFTTTPVEVTGSTAYKPVAHIVIDSRKVGAEQLTAFKNTLYGTDASGGSEGTAPTLPTPAQVIAAFTPAPVNEDVH